VSKFSGKKPKGDNWGIEQAVSEMAAAVIRGEHSPVMPVIAMISVDRVTVDSDTGATEATIVLRRIEAISPENASKALRLVMEEVAKRRGEGTMLPFDEKQIFEKAFGDLTATTPGQAIQDDEERVIDEQLDDIGRLRRHLVAVHDFKPDIITDDEVTPAELMRAHDAEHAKDPDDRTWPDHDADDFRWRRVELEDLVADSEEPSEPTTLYEVDGAITDDPNPKLSDSDPDEDEDPAGHGLIPEFESPGTAIDAESLNPTLEDDEKSGPIHHYDDPEA
jgi:hypothetical protein